MITDPDAYLRYFDSIHRRTLRDVAALPPAAETWAPPAGEGEQGWSIFQIVQHIAESRLYFAKAYRGEGWIYNWPAPITEEQATWLPALEAAAKEFQLRIEGDSAGVVAAPHSDDRHRWRPERLAGLDDGAGA